MKNALESGGSGSRSDANLLPSVVNDAAGDSKTVSFVSQRKDGSSSLVVNEEDKTVISQRPVASPQEFYRSLPLAELAAMLEGKQLDHFSVETMIGGGGMGAVFRGVDMRLDRVVAIKVIPASKRDPETLRRFRLEAQAAARLDHPNIARVYYVGEAEQWNYIVFEFIDGINIRDLVEMEGPLSIDDAVFYTRQVAEALQHAHERDVVHRDVKPSNVLVTVSGVAKLVDMGLARDRSLDKSTADVTASGVTLGTFDYISPEQARNPRDADVRSDLYSLGCTLFTMLTGKPPFPEGTALQKLLNHGSQPPPDPRGWRDDISDQLVQIMMKLMAKRPADRYQNPRDLVNDLLLLAEIENLPRSQGPTTLMLNPSIAQRTLLETNLPWLVAFAFLLGSTLWLQSFQSLSTGIDLQPLKFQSQASGQADSDAEPFPVAAQPPAETSSLADNNSVGLPSVSSAPPATVVNPPSGLELPKLDPVAARPPADTSAVLIVAALQPADVAASIWEPSLESAFRRLSGSPSTIEIRGPIVVRQTLSIARQDVQLRGSREEPAVLSIEPGVLENQEIPAVFVLRESKLRMSGIELQTRVTAASAAAASVFQVLGESTLQIDGCTLTIEGQSPNEVRVIQAGETQRPEATNMAGPMQLTSNAPRGTPTMLVSLRNSVIRGAASLVGISQLIPNDSPRLELSFEDVLVAINGVGLEMNTTGEIGSERIVRLFCKQSTFVTARGFAKLKFQGTGTPRVGLNRTSQSCIYWSSQDTPHISIQGDSAGLLENPNLLLLKGYDNAYDSQVQNLCQTLSGSSVLFDLSFADGQQEGWFTEQSTERSVRWRRSVHDALPFDQAVVEDFELVEGMFVPGFRNDALLPPRVE